MKDHDGDVRILIAEDEDSDYQLLRMAMESAGIGHSHRRFTSGAALWDWLLGPGLPEAARPEGPRLLILMDYRMPELDGAETLQRIRRHPVLRRLPVVMISSQLSPADIARLYELGAHSVLPKAPEFAGLVRDMRALRDFWLEAAALPAF